MYPEFDHLTTTTVSDTVRFTSYSMFISCMLTSAIKSVNHKLEVVCLHFHVLF